MAAEHQKVSGDFQAYAGADKVTGALGPLFYARVAIEGMPNEGPDPQPLSSLFREIGKQAKLSSRALVIPRGRVLSRD